MFSGLSLALTSLVGVFAFFSSSSTYSLQSYGVSSGATNNSTSTTYQAQGSVGETSGNSSSSTTYQANNGFINVEQANVPPAPTLSNNGGTYYNQLSFTLSTGNNPTDTTFAIAVSTGSCNSSPQYVQASGNLASTPVWQTNAQWTSTAYITGLNSNTTYYVDASAIQGYFTQTAYGPCGTAATVNPSITFAITPPNSQSLPTITGGGSIVTSTSNITMSLTTNANFGANIYVNGQYAGLKSPSNGALIPAYSGNLSGQTQGFGLQSVSATQLTAQTPFNGSGNTIGGETTTLVPIYSASSPVSGGSGSVQLQARASTTTPAAKDYQENLTFVAAASF